MNTKLNDSALGSYKCFVIVVVDINLVQYLVVELACIFCNTVLSGIYYARLR